MAPAKVVAPPVVELPWEERAAPAPTALPAPLASVPAEDDDEPPPGDEEYYQADSAEADAYLQSLSPEPETQAEPVPALRPATGLAAEWLALFPRLGISGMTGSIAANCTLVAVEGDTWRLHLDPDQGALFNATQQQRLNDALNQYHQRTLKLEIELCKPEQETPAQAAARQRQARQRAAQTSIEADPLVQQMVQQFAAVIRDGSIEPVESSTPPTP